MTSFRDQVIGTVDVLLIDDIQFLAGKGTDPGRVLPYIQCVARDDDQQIVIASDRPPKELGGL